MDNGPELEISSPKGLKKSLLDFSFTIKDEGPIMYNCGPSEDIEQSEANEAIEKALVDADVIPDCCNLNDGAVFCGTFNPHTLEYFLGVISEGGLEIEESPIFVNPDFCFGVTWREEGKFLRIIHKDPRLTMIYSQAKKFKEKHIKAILSFIEIMKKVNYNYSPLDWGPFD
jgi:hypothetical protein